MLPMDQFAEFEKKMSLTPDTGDNFRKQRLDNLLASLDELVDPKISGKYTRAYRGTGAEEYLVNFWKKGIQRLYKEVFRTPIMSYQKIMKSFQIQHIVPPALKNPSLILTLIKRGDLIELQYFNSPAFYPHLDNSSLLQRAIRGIFTSTKSKLEEGTILISTSFLNKVDKYIGEWVLQFDSPTMELQCLEETLADLGLTGNNIDLAIRFINGRRRLELFSLTVNDDYIQCVKIAKKNRSLEPVVEKEKAILLLNLNIRNLNKKIAKMEEKERDYILEIKELMRNKKIKLAKFLLLQKRDVSSNCEKFAMLKMQLEKQVLKIETWEAHANLLEVFKLAEKAHRSIKTDISEVENLFESLQSREEKSQELAMMVDQYTNKDLPSDEELEKELEELEGNMESMSADIKVSRRTMAPIYRDPCPNSTDNPHPQNIVHKTKKMSLA